MSLAHLEELKTLMPPLNPPPENNVDWQLAESVFGVRFPNDFKQFVATYGNVIWCDLFRAIYPETDTREKCEKSKSEVLETLTIIFNDSFCDENGDAIDDLKAYPSAGGLLPCLTDPNSSFMCWLTSGEPEDWTLVQWYGGTVRYFDCDLTQLIRDWIKQIPPRNDVWSKFFLSPKKYRIAR